MKRTYQFDQAATSFPKAEGVAEAMTEYLTQVGGNVGRGAYRSACDAAEAVLEVRERLCTLLGGPAPQNVILTPGCTYSLNFVLKGLLRPGDRVAVSGLEHNAVLRPLRQMEARGVTVDCLPCRATGELDLAAAERRLTPDTRLVVLTHASNVCGTLLPVAEVGALCRERGIFLCVDAAQTAGSVPIHMGKMHIDALAFPGHKGLLGPQGIGGLIVTEGYVSYPKQEELYKQAKEQYGSSAILYVDYPGHSEHQLGLAVDFAATGKQSEDFSTTPQSQWLQENAWRFGFVQSYTEDKVTETNKLARPEHYRYVGPALARQLVEEHHTLKEGTE